MPERPSVALIAHGAHDAGGMERYLAELVRHGAESIDFHLVMSHVAPDLLEISTVHRIRVPATPVPLLFSAFYVAAGRRLGALDVDLRHSMGALQPAPVDVTSVQFCHAAFAALGAETQRVDGGRLRALNRQVDRRISLAAERRQYGRSGAGLYLAASNGVRSELAEHYGITDSVVVPNGHDPQRFAVDARQARAFVKAEQGLPEGAVVAAFLGGDWVRKGLEHVFEGVAIARGRGASDLHLLVVGPGDRGRYEALAAARGIADAVSFVGATPTPERYLVASDVFVFPTAYEAFPLVAIEAAAAGLPLVATAVNGIEDLLVHERTGLEVTRDGASIGAALERLVADLALRGRMSEAIRHVASQYTWSAAAAKTLAAYEQALRSR